MPMTQPQAEDADVWVSVTEARRQLGLSESAFYELLRQGVFSDITLPPLLGRGKRRTRRVSQSEIDAFKAACVNVPAAAASTP